jgi:hypothetical protein
MSELTIAFGLVVVTLAGVLLLVLWQALQTVIRRRWMVKESVADPCAYLAPISAWHGEPFSVHISSSQRVLVTLDRIGTPGGQPDQVAAASDPGHCGPPPIQIEVEASVQVGRFSLWGGANWSQTLLLPTAGLATGMYRLIVAHASQPSKRWQSACMINADESHETIIVASTNTWNAYNDYGGLSNYRDAATPFPLRLIAKFFSYRNRTIGIGQTWPYTVILRLAIGKTRTSSLPNPAYSANSTDVENATGWYPIATL